MAVSGKKEKKTLAKQISIDERTHPKLKMLALLISMVLSSTGDDVEYWKSLLTSNYIDTKGNINWNGGVAAPEAGEVERIVANKEVKDLLSKAVANLEG